MLRREDGKGRGGERGGGAQHRRGSQDREGARQRQPASSWTDEEKDAFFATYKARRSLRLLPAAAAVQAAACTQAP